MIDDRFIRGIIAGVTGAFVQNIYAYFSKLLGFTDTLYLDVASAVLFNKKFTGSLVIIVSLLGQLVIDGFWGVGYAFLIKNVSSKYYIIKGIVSGCSIWFLVRVIITKIFDLPVLAKNSPKVALFFFMGASIFGATLALVLKLLNTKKQNV